MTQSKFVILCVIIGFVSTIAAQQACNVTFQQTQRSSWYTGPGNAPFVLYDVSAQNTGSTKIKNIVVEFASDVMTVWDLRKTGDNQYTLPRWRRSHGGIPVDRDHEFGYICQSNTPIPITVVSCKTRGGWSGGSSDDESSSMESSEASSMESSSEVDESSEASSTESSETESSSEIESSSEVESSEASTESSETESSEAPTEASSEASTGSSDASSSEASAGSSDASSSDASAGSSDDASSSDDATPSATRKPTRPTTKPHSTTKPSTPTTKPSTPTTKPSTPTTKPSTPTTKPSTPTTKPTTSTTGSTSGSTSGSSGGGTAGQVCAGGSWWQPSPQTTYQWQIDGTVDTSVDVQMYDIDMFDATASLITTLHNGGRVVVCYFSTQYEDWRPDASSFTSAVIGSGLDGWQGENYVDIRSDVVRNIMTARMDLAVSKGCDGLEPDNVDGYSNDNGFGLTAADQLDFNEFLASEAHSRGLSIGLKNDLEQAKDLEPFFDWALNEQCYEYDECDDLSVFINAGKAVFNTEYSGSAASICPAMVDMQITSLLKDLDLDASIKAQCCTYQTNGCAKAPYTCSSSM